MHQTEPKWIMAKPKILITRKNLNYNIGFIILLFIFSMARLCSFSYFTIRQRLKCFIGIDIEAQ